MIDSEVALTARVSVSYLTKYQPNSITPQSNNKNSGRTRANSIIATPRLSLLIFRLWGCCIINFGLNKNIRENRFYPRRL
jgi:hypothetical protein